MNPSTLVDDWLALDKNPTLKGPLFGIELEIENLPRFSDGERWDDPDWDIKTDGSLRNNGYEFVSSPLPLKHVHTALKRAIDKIKPTKESYSERTSVHVHVNMRGTTVDNVKSFCLLYLAVENLLFHYVNPERQKNIFCVPLSSFDSSNSFFGLFDKQVFRLSNAWSKYSALNLLPLSSFGTLEFRHMQGTDDVEYINQWVEFINCLREACVAKDFAAWQTHVFSLNSSSEYETLIEIVFKEHAHMLLRDVDNIKQMMYGNILKAKLWEYRKESALKGKRPVAAKKKVVPAVNTWFDEAHTTITTDERGWLTPGRPGAVAIFDDAQAHPRAGTPRMDEAVPAPTEAVQPVQHLTAAQQTSYDVWVRQVSLAAYTNCQTVQATSDRWKFNHDSLTDPTMIMPQNLLNALMVANNRNYDARRAQLMLARMRNLGRDVNINDINVQF